MKKDDVIYRKIVEHTIGGRVFQQKQYDKIEIDTKKQKNW